MFELVPAPNSIEYLVRLTFPGHEDRNLLAFARDGCQERGFNCRTTDPNSCIGDPGRIAPGAELDDGRRLRVVVVAFESLAIDLPHSGTDRDDPADPSRDSAGRAAAPPG